MTNSNLQKKLMAASDKSVPSPVASPPDYIRKMVYLPDRKLAAALVTEQAGLEFDTDSGKDIPCLEAEKAALDARYRVLRDELEALEHERKHTQRSIKCPNEERKPFLSWALKDQCAVVMLAPCVLAVMGMGAANTYANLMAAGEPVFLEQPWLAVCLSALVPCGSTALKFISHFFDHAHTKKRYALSVFVATILFIVAWSITFSLNFTGVTGGMDWEALGESGGGKGSLLVFLQIACEILIAAALFLALEDVSLIYNPPAYDLNPEFVEIETAYKALKPEHDKLGQQRNQATSALAMLKNARQQHVNNRLLEYHAYLASRTV